jgi:alpha-L-rhamnosidase/F5/8 type C domain
MKRVPAWICLALGVLTTAAVAADDLADAFASPPRDARLRAYWWWLNSCVTKQSITRDLEAMKAKGFGGAVIFDADGSSQDGNERAPHGPAFFSPEWREIYKHCLREASRLGLELSLNIQSGWNLGGPMVSPDDAAKKVVWSETRVSGPAAVARNLPEPAGREGYYRDAFVAAYRLKPSEAKNVFGGVKASSELAGHGVQLLADGDPASFWVSGGSKAGEGPSREHPQWVRFEFVEPVSVDRLTLTPRPGYGPSECELQVSDDGKAFRPVKAFTANPTKETAVAFDAVAGSVFRLVIFGSNDPRFPKSPRNAQIAELKLSGRDGSWPGGAKRRTLQNWEQKAGHKPLHFSAPDTSLLFEDIAGEPGEEDARTQGVLDLTAKLDKDGTLRWDAPEGTWQVLRFGYTIGDHSHVSTCSEGWDGFALDVLDAGAFRRYWDAVVEPLLADAGPLAGTTLKYLHTDSWEVEPLNWTPAMREEFRRRRGYDLLPWMPVLAGRIIESRNASNRFLHDFRKTLGDLAIDNHYRPFREGAHKHGLLIHPESGGPHAVPIDAQRCLGFDDAPMSEFWAWSWRHRIGDANRFFVKQPASAAHTYGRRLVVAEGFTTIGPHWQETLWDNLKPSFDKACCEGLNLLVWHAFVNSPAEYGIPGLQYFAGTHLNPNSTWWEKSAPFFGYINRCQALLQRGLFVADACYYYGDHAPNFAQHKRTDPAHVLPGFDYDVITEEALLTRAAVKDGRIVLPDGMSYRVLVLRNQKSISLAVLRKVKELVEAGAAVVGPEPVEAESLADSDAVVKAIASELWGKGRVVADKTGRDVLLAAGVKPDFDFSGGDAQTDLDYIHRRDGGADIYFIANRTNRAERVTGMFRVTGKAPELWDAVKGDIRRLPEFREEGGRTLVPLEFTPCGSMFIVFRAQTPERASGAKNFPPFTPVADLGGPWTVKFDPRWGGPASVTFNTLEDWTKRAEGGIRFYSGTATYTKPFEFDPSKIQSRVRETNEVNRKSKIVLDLGSLRELAEVRLNGGPLGVVWSPPFRVEVTGALKPGGNLLEIEVVNFWPNRIIGDASLPPEKRFTQTNIRKLTKDTPLTPSGLFGPVRLLTEDDAR